ncbi:MAG: S-layer homology domain-containing protein [Peptoniphilaceae bacterium]
MKKINKILSITLLSTVLISNITYAKSFKDLTTSGSYSWAYESVNNLSGKGVLDGYPNGTFKPQKAVSFLEVMQIIKNIKNPSKDIIDESIEIYGKDINKLGLPQWSKEAVAYNLKINTITLKTLSEAKSRGFLKSKNPIYPNRNSVTVYFARALNLSQTKNNNLKHKDLNSIPDLTKGYLSSLVDLGIYSDTGSDGYFNGNNYIRRAEIAIVADKAMEYLNNKPIEEDNLNSDNLINDIKEIKGIVTDINLLGFNSNITINNENYIFRENDVKILDRYNLLNNDIKNLENMNIKAEVNGNEIISIEILNTSELKKEINKVEFVARVIKSNSENSLDYIEVLVLTSNSNIIIPASNLTIETRDEYKENQIISVKANIVDNELKDVEIRGEG